MEAPVHGGDGIVGREGGNVFGGAGTVDGTCSADGAKVGVSALGVGHVGNIDDVPHV